MERVVTIHQPDFMPWYGFFLKLARSDLVIILDHVENNPRDAAFWCRRVRMLRNGSPTWISVPLMRPTVPNQIGMPINEMRIARALSTNLRKTRETVFQSYARCPFFGEIAPLVHDYFSTPTESLVACNMMFIVKVMKILRISSEILYSSSLDPKGASNELLLDLLIKTQATTYLCGTGAAGYQVDEVFIKHGIEVRRNEFEHPRYTQRASANFVPGLSIVDFLSSTGVGPVTTWIMEQARLPRS